MIVVIVYNDPAIFFIIIEQGAYLIKEHKREDEFSKCTQTMDCVSVKVVLAKGKHMLKLHPDVFWNL